MEAFQQLFFIVRCSFTIYTEWRESTPHTTNTTPQHAASRACLLHDGDVLRVLSACLCCLKLGVGSKESGRKRGGGRDGGGGGRGLGGRRCRGVCPCLCVGGVARRGSGRAAGTNRIEGDSGGRDSSGGDPGMVATSASGMQPARRGDRWARPLRAARVRTTKQL